MSWEDRVAFACGELGLRLSEFLDMPWCEYIIMSENYNRSEDDNWLKLKWITFNVITAPSLNPKTLPRDFDSYLKSFKGKGNVRKASEQIKDFLKEEIKEYKRLTAKK